MANPVFYQTMNNVGIDPTQYYANVFTAGASITPEYPAAPFLPGTKAIGSDGSEFVFVQCNTSTAINLTDFVLIQVGSSLVTTPYQANSITTTNVVSSLGVGLASTGLVLRQSVTTIPTGAFFWACTKGQFLPATTSGGTTIESAAGGLASSAGGVLLFTTSVAGAISSVTTSQSLHANLAGITVINSLTVSIPSSIVPPAGDTKSNGFTVGPVVALNNPRTVITWSSSVGNLSLAVFSF